MASLMAMDRNLGKLWEMVRDREAWCTAVHEATENQTSLSNNNHNYLVGELIKG